MGGVEDIDSRMDSTCVSLLPSLLFVSCVWSHFHSLFCCCFFPPSPFHPTHRPTVRKTTHAEREKRHKEKRERPARCVTLHIENVSFIHIPSPSPASCIIVAELVCVRAMCQCGWRGVAWRGVCVKLVRPPTEPNHHSLIRDQTYTRARHMIAYRGCDLP